MHGPRLLEARSLGIDMTNYESLEVVCVIKEKEVVWKYKGERGKGKGQAGETPEEMDVGRERGQEQN